MSTDTYINEGLRQLTDTKTYKALDHDPTPQHLQKVKTAVGSLDVNSDLKKKLIPKDPRRPNMYFLPKIHKPNNPGRPIVSGCACPTVQISRFLDFHLRPLVEKLPSHLKDTTDFLNHINDLNLTQNPLPPESILVTADVTSLYTNIPHNEGIKACRNALNARMNPSPPTDQLIRLLELVLTLNNFQFNGKNYLQIEGTAMGTPVAPSYANIFMGEIEAELLELTNAIFPRSWKRYIDDIIFIWTQCPQSLAQFQNTVNALHPRIKFTFESSPDCVNFLDLKVLSDDGTLQTELYSKPTDSHTFLPPSSCHPRHVFKSIPYSQALRIKRNCSQPESTDKHLENLQHYLDKCDYPPQQTKLQINRARSIPRAELFDKKERPPLERTPFVLTYSPATAKLHKILKKEQNTLDESASLSEILSDPPLVAYRRPRTLRDLLTYSGDPKNDQLNENNTNGFAKCEAKRCMLHNFVKEGNKFKTEVSRPLASLVVTTGFGTLQMSSEQVPSLSKLLYCGRTLMETQ
ncbi:uncharacterized protein [Diadema antillarum]|uniref:uncharacterized protein n=1 Tax=Diadema antillarum TaxID=105358 RepID=UPI003A8BB89E